MASVAGASGKRQAASRVRESDKSESSAKCSQLRQSTAAVNCGSHLPQRATEPTTAARKTARKTSADGARVTNVFVKAKIKSAVGYTPTAPFLFRALSA